MREAVLADNFSWLKLGEIYTLLYDLTTAFE